jgi:hypothetical protein
VTGTKVIDNDVRSAAGFDLAKYTHTKVKILERRALSDFEVEWSLVEEQWIRRLHQPALSDFLRVQVDEHRLPFAVLEDHISDHPTQPAARFLLLGFGEQG